MQNDDGGYTFFTRGVDRITRRIDNIVAQNFLNNPFEDPDALWTSFQEKLNDYVNQNGGDASFSVDDSVTFRPDWADINDVLDGTKSITDLGCK